MITLKRVYDAQEPDDGARYLVDRLWPRGIKKEDLKMDAWLKELAPSTELRHWFSHDPAKWPEFKIRYKAELDTHPELWRPLVDASKKGNVTLLYAANDTEHNNARELKSYLDDHLQ